MLVVCSDIHVQGSPLMSVVVTRVQDLASEFSSIFPDDTPDLTAGGGDPLPHPSPARPLAGRGAQASRCLDPNLGTPQFFNRGCASRPKLFVSSWTPSNKVFLQYTLPLLNSTVDRAYTTGLLGSESTGGGGAGAVPRVAIKFGIFFKFRAMLWFVLS